MTFSPHKNRNGRTRAERRYSPKQSPDHPRTKTTEPPHNLPALLRRKKRLNQRNQKNQNAQKHRNLDDVKQKKRHSTANFRLHTKPGRRHTTQNKLIQPLHPQNLILNKIPHNLLYNSFYFCSGGFLFRSITFRSTKTRLSSIPLSLQPPHYVAVAGSAVLPILAATVASRAHFAHTSNKLVCVSKLAGVGQCPIPVILAAVNFCRNILPH